MSSFWPKKSYKVTKKSCQLSLWQDLLGSVDFLLLCAVLIYLNGKIKTCLTRPQKQKNVTYLSKFCFFCFFFLRKRKERNKIRFITAKKAIKMTKVSIGCLGASVASSIMGKPKTMAGRF